jgi:hypothetical protein
MQRLCRSSVGSILLAAITILTNPVPSSAADPGTAIPTSSEASDQKPGAALIYNLFSSGKKHDTRISVTNTSEATAGVTRMFFVDGTTGAASVKDVCLGPLQTASIRASQVSPNQTGYVLAVAIDLDTGLPLDFNFLSGQAAVTLPNKYRATIPAVALAKLTASNVVSTDGTLAALFLDGLSLAGSYNKATRVLQISDIPSAQDRTATLVVVNRIGGNLAPTKTAATLGNFGGNLFSDLGASAAIGTALGTPQFVAELNDGFPAVPNFSTMVPAGHTGWMKLFSPSDIGVFGAVLYGQSGKPGKKIKDRKVSRPDGGVNMRALTTTSSASVVIPVLPVTCN